MKYFFFAVAVLVAIVAPNFASADAVFLPIVQTPQIEYDDLTEDQIASALNYLFVTSLDGEFLNDYGCSMYDECLTASATSEQDDLLSGFAVNSVEYKALRNYAEAIAQRVNNKEQSNLSIRFVSWDLRRDLYELIDGQWYKSPLPSNEVGELFSAFDRAFYNGDCVDNVSLPNRKSIQETTNFLISFVCSRMYD